MPFPQLRALLSAGVPAGTAAEDTVRRQWWAALSTLQDDLLLPEPPEAGVWLAAPLPALFEPSLLHRLQGWVWTPASLDQLLGAGAPLLPGGPMAAPSSKGQHTSGASLTRLRLREQDGTDPLLLLLTPRLQVALALDGASGARRLLARFDAAVLAEALPLLMQRLQEDDAAAAQALQTALQALGPLHNDPDLALRFWPLLAQRLAAMAPSVTLQPLVGRPSAQRSRATATATATATETTTATPAVEPAQLSGELALLEALTHEVRTPLATIRTLIRSLLRRRDLPPVVRQRLEQIDSECSEQIDRFGLIFLAAELQRQPGSSQPLASSDLARTHLDELLLSQQDGWERQLERRGLQLQLVIAADLPPVLSDPARLATMLGGLLDRFSRGLASGSSLRLSLQPAGSRLKLQLRSQVQAGDGSSGRGREQVGPVLSWDPGTGSLQLSRQATRQLFHRLGGRLTERGASSLTVFFPLAPGNP